MGRASLAGQRYPRAVLARLKIDNEDEDEHDYDKKRGEGRAKLRLSRGFTLGLAGQCEPP
jgi:hypothetical protein